MIKSIFEEISNEPGTNRKMEILAVHKAGPHSVVLERVLYLANSKRIKFYIKQIPAYTTNGKNIPLKDAIEMLIDLSDRKVSGQSGIDHLANILASVSPNDAHIIERIIEKDCKLGMGTTNINKIFMSLIENTPYMGAVPYKKETAQAIFADPKNAGYAYSQIKMDGRYCNAIVRDGEVLLESREGNPTYVGGAKFLKELATFADCVLNGELTMDGVSRYDSNGIIASLVSIGSKKNLGEDVVSEIREFEKKKKMGYQKALDSIRFTVWDTIKVDEYFACVSNTPYHDRLVNLSKILKPANPTMVSFIKTKKVYSFEQALVHFQENLNEGQEGTILKASMGTWEDNKPKWQVKMKLEMHVDMRITGFNYGTGKNAQLISSIDVESSDGLVKTSPCGMKESVMKHVTANQSKLLGTILEVTCSGLSNDSTGNYSLLHPRLAKGDLSSFRDDKTTCDSLQSIKDIEAAAKALPTATSKVKTATVK